MAKDDSGAKVPPAGQNLGQGRTDIESARPNVLQELRASVKDSEDNARLGLGEIYLPIDGFRPEIRDILNNTAEDFDAHRDKSVLAALEAVAMVTGYKVSAKLKFQKYINHASLYGMLIDVQGGVKSSINKFFMDPVLKLDRKARARFRREMNTYNSLSLEDQKNEERPVPNFLVTQGFTTERLQQLDSTSSTGVSFYKDEKSGHYKSIGKYSANGKSEHIELELTLFDGVLEVNDRVSDFDDVRESRETAYSTYGTIQPTVFDEIFIPLIQSKNGYFNRFLYVFTEPRKHRYIDCFSEMKSKEEEWEAVINDIAQCPSGTVYEYEEAAGFRYAQYINKHVVDEENKDLYSENPFTSYLSRNRANVLRLAITIHVLNDWRSPVITDKEMDMAIRMQQTFNKYAQKCLSRLPSTSRPKAAEDSPAEAIKMMYRLNMAKGNPASAVNQSDLAKMLGVSQAYVNKVKSTMINNGDITDDDSSETVVTPADPAPAEVTQQSQEPAEVQEPGSTVSAEGDGETTGKENAVIPAEEDTLESQDSPTPSVPPKIRSGDDNGGNAHVSSDEDSGGSTS